MLGRDALNLVCRGEGAMLPPLWTTVYDVELVSTTDSFTHRADFRTFSEAPASETLRRRFLVYLLFCGRDISSSVVMRFSFYVARFCAEFPLVTWSL